MREDQNMKDAKILLVNPSATYILKECADKKIVNDLKQDLKINEMEWVFYESIHPISLESTPPPSDFFHFYTIQRFMKVRKILKISGQNTYGNYIFYVSGDCHFCLLGFLKIPFSDIEFSFKLPKFEKYPSKLPANTYLYRLLSKDSKNHT